MVPVAGSPAPGGYADVPSPSDRSPFQSGCNGEASGEASTKTGVNVLSADALSRLGARGDDDDDIIVSSISTYDPKPAAPAPKILRRPLMGGPVLGSSSSSPRSVRFEP